MGVSVGVRVWVRNASRLVELTILLENLQIGARARVDAVGRAHVDGLLDDLSLGLTVFFVVTGIPVRDFSFR